MKLADLSDRVAVVTGASSGIGRALAAELAARGATVAVVGRHADRLRGASVHVCDVTKPDQVQAAAREILDRWGRIDLLVTAAGEARHVQLVDQDTADAAGLMRTNYDGTLHWVKAVLPAMRAQGAGWIVTFSSFAGLVPQPDEAAYSATKAAVTALSEALAWELAPLGVHVLCVHPALVRTPMFTPEVMARMPAGTDRRFVSPDALARGVLAALARGERSVVLPRRYGWIAWLRRAFPWWIARKMARVRLGALPGRDD